MNLRDEHVSPLEDDPRAKGVSMALVLTYGSSGSQGEPLTRKLLEAGHALRAVVRHPERAAALQARGAEVVKGDLSDFESLNTASAGVDAVFLMMPFSAGGNPFELMGNALKAAKEGGAKLLVFNAGGHPPSAPTGIPTIILRPGVYMENFLGPSCLPSIQHRDAVAYPHRSAMRVSWIASDDLGAFAVAALERPELAGQRLTLGVPEALDGPAIAHAFSAALGREITYDGISPAAFSATMVQILGPEVGEGIGIACGYSNAQPDDSMAVQMDSVLEQLPVRLTRLEDWVRQCRAAFTKA